MGDTVTGFASARLGTIAATLRMQEKQVDRCITEQPEPLPAGVDFPGMGERISLGKRILGKVELGGNLTATGASAGSPEEFVLLPSKGATLATLVFSGNHGQFVLPDSVAARTDTHVLLLRDPRRCFCLAGIHGLGADYRTTRLSLEKILRRLGAGQRYCIGVSAGGAAALKFGCDLRAEGVLGFSIPTTLDIADDPGAELQRYPQLWKLYQVDRSLGIDLAAYYRSRRVRPRLTLVHSAGHVRDRWLAKRMRKIRGVELIETPGYCGHATYRWMKEQGAVEEMLGKLYRSRRGAFTDVITAVSSADRSDVPAP